MGETAVETRLEVEATRQELGGTIAELRSRGERARETVRRRLPLVAAGVAAVAGGSVVAVLVIRSRRRAPARTAVQRQVERLRKERDELVDRLAERVARQQAKAQRRENPLWRRTAAKALETAATVGVATAVRSAVVGARSGRA